MSGALMKVELADQDIALSQLGALIARTSNPVKLFQDIGASLVTSTQHRFDTETAVDGSPWPPSLRVKAHGGKTLQLSGRLYRSITAQAAPTGVEIGTNVIYAAIHQFGGPINQGARKATIHFKAGKTGQQRFSKKKGATSSKDVSIGARTITMPARPFIGLDDADDRAILKIAEAFLAGPGGSLQ
jgi:phage virion morphogenesis protein